MRVLETRTTEEGFKRRRYEHKDGRRTTTIEVPLRVWNAVNKQRKTQNRIKRETLKTKVLDLVNAGWKPLAVSFELGVPLRTVHRWRRSQKELPSNV